MIEGPSRAGASGRAAALAGALAFLLSLLYGAYQYTVTFGHPVAAMPSGASVGAIVIDAVLFGVFALHHSVFARLGTRLRVSRLVSPALERTLYVWVASALFALVCYSWRPVPGTVWQAGGGWTGVLIGVQTAGVLVTLFASRALDVLDLAGLRQAFGQPPARPDAPLTSGLYALVRHPIYLGWFLMVWPAPRLTGTRLVFAAVTSLYLLAAIPAEERSLRRTFGEAYDRYARRVRWRVVPGVY